MSRPRLVPGFAVLLAATLLAGSATGQDFDPRGRKKPKPAPTRPTGPRPAAPGGPAPSGSATPGGPTAPKPANEGEGAANASVLLERYTRIVLSQPGAPFPLQRLVQLYRERDGNLTALVADMEKRSSGPGPEQYAALVTLAGLYKVDGRADDAIRTYEKAIALKGDDAAAVLALARALQDRGDLKAARARYEDALKLQTVAADKEQTLRTLLGLALDAKEWDEAKRCHDRLVKLQPTSLFVKGELGRELFARGEYERAEGELKALVLAAQGDNRTLAPALKDLGRAQAKAHKNQEALATLKRALAAAGQEAAVRTEIYETITEVYRADQQLPVLIRELEAERPSDFARVALLASLYDEVGDAANAIAYYRRALALDGRQIDLRVRLIRILQSQGDLDKAIAEYDGLIRAAPNNPQFVFEQCEALLQRGDRARALSLLAQLEARARGDEEVLSRLAEFYGRIGEGERSTRVLQRLAQVSTGDPSHLVDLGDRYFQDGNTALAVQTWKRILTTVTPRSRALAALGDVYLEHDMVAEALAMLREAVQLDANNYGLKKQLAAALERSRNYREARQLWQEIGDRARGAGDKLAVREARSRIVTLWGLERVLEQQIGPLEQRFRREPPDVEAGRLLAEVYTHLRRGPEAEAVLRRVVELAPGDPDAYLALERVLVQQNKLQEAIAVLERLAVVEPKRARELYQRMAQYAMQTYRDEEAIKYAARAVELNPDDAEGHRRLGDMYRSRQDVERAIREYRLAISKNERLYPVYFAVADLLLSRGEAEEADRLYRRILRGAPDEELVGRAARLSMQINLGRGTLESLERDLLPLAIGNPQRGIYRRLLVEVYGNLTFGLMQRVRTGTGKDAEEARTALARIGARAVKPLLDALAEGDPAQQRVAIDVLGYVANKNAGPALFAFATGQGDTQLRTRAMVACGALRDPALLPRYEALLVPKRGAEAAVPSDAVTVAAVWGVARLGDKRAVPMLRTLLRDGTPEMQALAALGVGAHKEKSAAADVAALAKRFDGGPLARGAAAYALGSLGVDTELPTLLAMAQGAEALTRQMALLGLAKLGEAPRDGRDGAGTRSAVAAMAEAVFSGPEGDSARAQRAAEAVTRAGVAALVHLAAGGREGAGRDPFPVPDGPLAVEDVLAQLVPKDITETQRAAAFLKYGDALEQAALSALRTSAERSHAVLDALSGPEGTFLPWVRPGASVSPEVTERAKALARRLEPSIVPLVRHPDVTLRTKAITILARSRSDAAVDAVVAAVEDGSENVARVALASLGPRPSAKAVGVASKVLVKHDNWAMRVLAAEALGRLGAAGGGPQAGKSLADAAVHDSYALVREAALSALGSVDPKQARDLASRMAANDPEPRVRETAQKIAAARGSAP